MFKKIKNNKGYTLVEIIAAIVILALLILIAVPAINKQLINFRLNYYKKLENSVVSASKDYVTDRRYSKPTKLFHSKVIKVSDLEKEGYIDEVKDYLGKKCDSTDTSYSYVVVVKTGEKQYDYTTCLKCNQDEYATDTTGQKNNYCDTAWMNDNNIEYELREDVGKKLYVYYGTNEESIRDELRLTYDVVKKNNDGEVLAKTESDDENDALYPQNIGELVGKNVNTVINLKYILPSGETLQKQAVIYKHNQPEIEMKYGVDNIYSGKKENDVYSNGSDEWASNLVVKISYSQNDVKEVIDAIALKDIEYYDEVRKKWIETNCTVSSDKKSCIWTVKNDFDKEIKFRVVNDRSKKGDSGDYYSIKVDAHKPECTLNKSGIIGLDNWYTSDVTFNFDTKTDVLSGVGKFDITDSKTQTFNNRATSVLSTDSTNKTYYGHVVDKAGNTNICDITVKRDATKPSCSINPTGTIGDNNWYTSDVAIALSTDDATSKVLSYGLSRSTTATYNKAASSSLKDDTTGVTYYGYVKDNAGNTNSCSKTVKRDTTPPTCKIEATGDNSGGIFYSTVNIKMTPSGHSYYGMSTTNSTTYNSVSTDTITSDVSGRTYYGFVKDAAGWTNTCNVTVTRVGKVSVSFDGNGNTGGSTAAQQCLYNASCTLNANGFTKTGYTFTGWNTKSDGSGTSYSSSGTFTAGTTLYAQWRVNKLYIYYNANGASISSSTYSLSSNNVYSGGSRFYQTINYGSSSDPYNAATFGLYLTGHTFQGWNTNSSGTGTTFGQDTSYAATTYKSDLTSGDKKLTLYAIYTANTYTLTYNSNNGSACNNTTGTYGSTWGTLCSPTRANYTFNGWYDGSTKVESTTKITGNRSVTASWTAIKPTCNGASGNGSSSSAWATSRSVTVACKNPDGTACSSVSQTYTSSGSKSLTIKGSNGETRSCSFTVYNIDTGTPTVTYSGQVSSASVQCPSGRWLDKKWAFAITNTTSGFRESGSKLVATMSGVGTYTHNYGEEYPASGGNIGCAFFSTTEFGFARSSKPSFSATACNNAGTCKTATG